MDNFAAKSSRFFKQLFKTLKKLFGLDNSESFKIVVLSLLLATTFWIFNSLNSNYTTRINYPISYEFSRDSLVLVDPLPEKIRLEVSGGGWNLLRKTLWFNIPAVRVPIDKPLETRFLVRANLQTLFAEQITELEINSILVDTLFVNIQRLVNKDFLLYVDSLNIPLEENYRLTSEIELEKDSIRISGPEFILQSFGDSIRLRLEEKTLSKSFDKRVEVQLKHEKEHLFLKKPDRVKVAFEVAEFEYQRLFVNVEAFNFPSDSSAYLAEYEVEVKFLVRSDYKNRIKADDFSVSADFRLIDKSDNTVRPMLLFYPDEIEDISFIPEELPVNFKK